MPKQFKSGENKADAVRNTLEHYRSRRNGKEKIGCGLCYFGINSSTDETIQRECKGFNEKGFRIAGKGNCRLLMGPPAKERDF